MNNCRPIMVLLAGVFVQPVLATTSCATAAPVSSGAVPFIPPLWTVFPFIGILLSIAIFPLTSGRWWDRHYGWISLFWAAATVAAMLAAKPAGRAFGDIYGPTLFTTASEYISFIILLGGLFIISGGIHIRGALSGKPLSNLGILAVGSVLANLIGTTGAAMLLIRPLLHSVRWRHRKVHVVVFFIFSVCNIGGCLTPVGDPPLFIGFLKGIPFAWTLQLAPHWLLGIGALLAVFYLLDRHLMQSETGQPPDVGHRGIHLAGAWNFLGLLGVIAAVLFSGVVHLGRVNLPFGQLDLPGIIRDLAIVAIAGLSIWLTPKSVRAAHNFNYHPIREVAGLFFGIFCAMVPTLMLLDASGATLGLDTPAKLFWASGALSSFLDNTPTYLAFFETVRGLLGGAGAAQILAHPLGAQLIKAISIGSVFMGANTYIGNGPNFMVKSIAEQEGVKMPSFFGYMAWSVLILFPLYLLVSLVFFR